MINNLAFLDICKQSFGIMLINFGFSISQVQGYHIRYESKNVYIKVSYDEREGEIFVDIGKLINGKYTFEIDFKHEFSLNELLSEVRPEKVYKSKVVREDEGIEIELYRLSRILEEGGEDILNGKVEIFSKLLENRIKEQIKQEKNEYITNIKGKAELAFKKGDYKSTVSLYKMIESDLNPTDKKRYEIAMKKYGIRGHNT